MDKEIKHQSGGDFLAFVAWAHANRKGLWWALGLVVVAGLGVGVYFMHQANREEEANVAFCALNLPGAGDQASTAAQFAQVADDYPGTIAGAHALLVAGGINFETGQFEAARAMFGRFLADHGDSPLASEAAVGIAVCLEVEDNQAEATAHYEAVLQRSQDFTWPQVKSALARLYEEQNHPDRALQQYKELFQANGNDSWTLEARVQAEELLEKYPNLLKQVAAPAAPAGGPSFNMVKP